MFYFKNTKVYNPHTYKDFRYGGYVNQLPDMTDEQVNNDSLRAILMPNELVIPTKYVPIVSRFLRKNKIFFGNFR